MISSVKEDDDVTEALLSHVTRTRRNKSVANKFENFQKKASSKPLDGHHSKTRRDAQNMDWARTSSRQQGQFRESKIGPQITKKHQHFKWREEIPVSYWIVFSLQVYRGRRKVYRKKNRHSKKKASLLFSAIHPMNVAMVTTRVEKNHECLNKKRRTVQKTHFCFDLAASLETVVKRKMIHKATFWIKRRNNFDENIVSVRSTTSCGQPSTNWQNDSYDRAEKWQNLLGRGGFKHRWKLSQQDGYKPWPMSEETKKIIVELWSFSIFSIKKCTWKNRCERCHRFKIKRMPFRTSISWRCQTSRSREAISW